MDYMTLKKKKKDSGDGFGRLLWSMICFWGLIWINWWMGSMVVAIQILGLFFIGAILIVTYEDA
jgi:hypothetical protein